MDLSYAVAYWKCINQKIEMKVKKDKLTEGFIKLMTDMGATFVDVTSQKKKYSRSGSSLPKSKKK